MTNALKKLRKLKGRSLHELRVRGQQALAARAERGGLSSLARLPSDAALYKLLDPARINQPAFSPESLLKHFRTRSVACFFPSFADKDATCAELRARFAGAEAMLMERAARILEGRFDLLGLRDLSFGSPVNWHLEPIAGVSAPRTHWSTISFLDPRVSGDKKITWELNRHQFFQTLGRAYWRTGDERFAQSFVAHVAGWMDANPPKLGINWASSLEVSFRVISWLWALHFFKDSPHLTPQVFLRLCKFLHLQARHLETYLSTYFSPNTHLTGEALGLFYLGALLPEFKDSARWRATGERVLLAELARHVRPDGVYFEQSTYYHRYTTDFYLHLAILARANGAQLDGQLTPELTALLDHLMYVTRPDGTTPLVGDDDGGRLVMLDERPANDFRAALSTGAALFGRADYKFVAGEAAEETLWLLGRAGLQTFDALDREPPAQTSRAFPDSGYYVMRDGWTRESNYLLLDCGVHGARRANYGHAHADALSFDLAAHGRTLVVDPGTYTYTASREWRDHFRSSAAHNTLVIDGASSSVPGATAFRWQHIAQARTHLWQQDERFDFCAGEQDGYLRLPAPATHLRRILFLKGDYWIMRDRVETQGAHHYDLRFQLSADAAPHVETEADEVCVMRERKSDAPGLDIFTFNEAGEWRSQEGWVSPCYGARVAAPACIFSANVTGATEFITFLIPRRHAQPDDARVREIEAAGGRAFVVHAGAAARDYVLLGDGEGSVQTAGLASNFAQTWVRCGADDGEPQELVLIDGSRLEIAGREVLQCARRTGYVCARRVGDEWRVRRDAGVEVSVSRKGSAKRESLLAHHDAREMLALHDK